MPSASKSVVNRHMTSRNEVADSPLLWRSADCLPLSAQGCRRCAEACPVDALTISADGPAITSFCTDCARCAAACPTDALALAHFPAPDAPRKISDTVFIDCLKVPPSMSPENSIRVPCLGGISTGWLLTLQNRIGDFTITALDRGWCTDCNAGDKSRFSATATITDAARLLGEAGTPESLLPRIKQRPLPADQMPAAIPPALAEAVMSRRAFFSRAISGVAGAATSTQIQGPGLHAPSLHKHGHVMPAEQLRRLAALTNISHRHARPLPSSALPNVAISQDICRNHGVCAAVCPTGALAKHDNDGAEGIRFKALLCTDCGQCARACPEHAVRIFLAAETAPVRWETDLTSHEIKICTTCEDEFSGVPGNVCTACRKTEALFAGRAILDELISKPAA